jgi:hypothetical protein
VIYRNPDSYCGPICRLQQLPSGELLLAFREAKWRNTGHVHLHRDPTTRTSLLRSRDDGASWFSHVTPLPDGGNGVGISRLSDGTLFVCAYQWRFSPPERPEDLKGLPRQGHLDALDLDSAGGGVLITRSLTDGYTWTAPQRIPFPSEWPDLVAHAGPSERSDGTLLLPTNARRGPEERNHAVILESDDGGSTWRAGPNLTANAPGDFSFAETQLVTCPSGRMIAMHRTNEQYWQNVSEDGGHTWSDAWETPIWCGGSSPAEMRVLSDGRLLLTRGYRREPFGVRAYLSRDEGDTWDVENEIVLRDDGPNRDVGYPSTVELSDGRLFTVYYWQDEEHIRHVQGTWWKPPK